MTRVRMKHLRKAKICSEGARGFWRRRNWDWSKFLSEGIPAEELEATGDAQALEVVEIARGER